MDTPSVAATAPASRQTSEPPARPAAAAGPATAAPQPVPAAERTAPVPAAEAAPASPVPALPPEPAAAQSLPAPPVPPETASVFIPPPPPIRNAVAPAGGTFDERTDAPVSLADDDEVLIEEEYFAAPEPVPASQITQPIQISPRHSSLPEPRSGEAEHGTLPRLDVTRGEAAPSETQAPFFVPTGQGPARTRIQLPKPGESVEATKPGDFVVLDPPPVPRPLSPPAAPDSPEPASLSETQTETSVEESLPSEPPIEPASEEEIPYTTIPIPTDEIAVPLDDIEPLEDYDPEIAELSDDDAGDYSAEEPTWSDSAPESEADWAAYEAVAHQKEISADPSEPTIDASSTDSFLSPDPDEAYAPLPPNPLHEGSFGKLFSHPVEERSAEFEAHSPISARPNPDYPNSPPKTQESFEDLFGTAAPNEGSAKMSRTTIVMISCVVAVAIISVVVVVFLIRLFGGLSPSESYVEQSEEEVSTRSAETDSPALSRDDSPSVLDPVALPREHASSPADAPAVAAPPADPADAPALAFEERVREAVNGTTRPAAGSSVIGAPSLDLVEDPVATFSTPALVSTPPATADTGGGAATPPVEEPSPPATEPLAGASEPKVAKKDPNYNPPASFAAPGPNDSLLGKTHDLIDAFLRAPDIETRLRYAYGGDSLRPAAEDYHQKWPFQTFGRYSLTLFNHESNPANGGPYWFFLVSSSDQSEGIPLVVLVEDGLLKIDWEIYREFFDSHFVKFREGAMPRPSTFRLVIERVSDYYGTDREAFADIADYQIYKIGPPYGGPDEFTEYAFVKKDSEVANQLGELIALGEDPLAVIVTIDEQPFAHGVKHYVISEFHTEGWFR